MTKLLMLVSCEKITFTSKRTREKVTKFKYLFLKPPGTYATDKDRFLTGWGDRGVYASDATNELVFKDGLAKEYPFVLKEFNGAVSEHLVEPEGDQNTEE